MLLILKIRLHCESKCGTVRSYACKECGSKFMTQNTLNSHILIHKGDKKYLCNFCGNSFLSRGQLKIHERSHTKEKPYNCLVGWLKSVQYDPKNYEILIYCVFICADMQQIVCPSWKSCDSFVSSHGHQALSMSVLR